MTHWDAVRGYYPPSHWSSLKPADWLIEAVTSASHINMSPHPPMSAPIMMTPSRDLSPGKMLLDCDTGPDWQRGAAVTVITQIWHQMGGRGDTRAVSAAGHHDLSSWGSAGWPQGTHHLWSDGPVSQSSSIFPGSAGQWGLLWMRIDQRRAGEL